MISRRRFDGALCQGTRRGGATGRALRGLTRVQQGFVERLFGAHFAKMRCSVRRCMLRRRAVSDTCASAQLIDALDVLPPHPAGRHRILGHVGLFSFRSEQGGDHIVGVGRLRQIIEGAEVDRGDGGRDIAVAGEHDAARVGAPLLERGDHVESGAIGKPHIDDGEGRRALFHLLQARRPRFPRSSPRSRAPPGRGRAAATNDLSSSTISRERSVARAAAGPGICHATVLSPTHGTIYAPRSFKSDARATLKRSRLSASAAVSSAARGDSGRLNEEIAIAIVLMRFAFRIGNHFGFSDRTAKDFRVDSPENGGFVAPPFRFAFSCRRCIRYRPLQYPEEHPHSAAKHAG